MAALSDMEHGIKPSAFSNLKGAPKRTVGAGRRTRNDSRGSYT